MIDTAMVGPGRLDKLLTLTGHPVANEIIRTLLRRVPRGSMNLNDASSG